MNPMVLLVTYTAKPGMGDAFLREVADRGILAKIRQEDGCLAYEYYRSAEDPEKILLLERWESPFHQKVHMSQPHMAELSQLKDSYIADVQLQRLSLM